MKLWKDMNQEVRGEDLRDKNNISKNSAWKTHKKKFNKYVNIENYLLSRACDVNPCCVFMDVCFVLHLFCLSTCVCVYT